MADRDKGLLEKAKSAAQGFIDAITEAVVETFAPEPRLVPIPVRRPRRPVRRRRR